jgi:glycosyltransferase involved in cell wall biosynthesis
VTDANKVHPLQGFRGEEFVRADGTPRDPTQAELNDARFAPGTASEHPYAVLYQGEFETPWDGTAAAVRLHARALALMGIPVRLTSFSHCVTNEHGYADPVHEVGLPAAVENEVGSLYLTRATTQVPVIRHAVVRSAEHAVSLLVPRGAVAPTEEVADIIAMRRLVASSTILYSVWERDHVDDSMARELNRAGQLWVPCAQNAAMLAKSGVLPERLSVVPHPYDPEDDICKVAALKRAHRGQHEHGWRLFYSIGRWEPRKGYAELIQAFLLAFKPADRVMLTIKHTGNAWKGYPTPEEAMRSAVAHAPNWTAEQVAQRIVLLSGRGPRTGILELHYRNNIYVSSSHGEAWCLPAFEARLAGNALVAVPYGGVVDFMGPDGSEHLSVVEPSGMALAPDSYQWPVGTKWCGFDVSGLASALQRAQCTKEFALPEDMKRFELRRVGEQMLDLIMPLAQKVKPEAARYYKERMNG